MKMDKLKQYVALRDSLLKEKSELESRLAEINRALGSDTGDAAAAPRSTGAGRGGRRLQNPMSLKEAVSRVTASRPLSKPEILEAIKKIGYRFQAKDPTNSLNVVLYTKGQFKNHGGKFSPAK
jgi:hypothetical protein